MEALDDQPEKDSEESVPLRQPALPPSGRTVKGTLLTVVHLSAFGCLGVFVRSWLKVAFSCYATNHGTCLSLHVGPLCEAFAPNALGCFVFGLLSTPKAAGLDGDRQLACLHRDHPWQTRDRLVLGLRTGFCGALTTWASWNQAMVVHAASGDWATALLGFLLGVQVAATSTACGQHSAAALSHWHARAVVPAIEDGESLMSTVEEPVAQSSRCNAADIFVAVLFLALPVTCSVMLGTAAGPNAFAFVYGSSLLAPAGVLLRWQLTRLNTFHTFLPCGTLVANTAACVLCAAVAQSSARPLLATVIMDGIGGSLSTVSTVCGETNLLFITGPRWRGYAYLAVTWILGFGGALYFFSLPKP